MILQELAVLAVNFYDLVSETCVAWIHVIEHDEKALIIPPTARDIFPTFSQARLNLNIYQRVRR